jgi:transposase
MAVRGLGCPVRFTLTAGQRGDCPQAYALIDGLPAKVVMADAAYDADRLRQVIADKDAVAVIPNNPSRAQRYPIDKHLYAQRHLSNVASQSSNSSDASRHASRKQPETISPSSPSQLPSYGSDNCPQLLALSEVGGACLWRKGFGYLNASFRCQNSAFLKETPCELTPLHEWRTCDIERSPGHLSNLQRRDVGLITADVVDGSRSRHHN